MNFQEFKSKNKPTAYDGLHVGETQITVASFTFRKLRREAKLERVKLFLDKEKHAILLEPSKEGTRFGYQINVNGLSDLMPKGRYLYQGIQQHGEGHLFTKQK